MALLHEIQTAVVQDKADLGSILLKLRLLASRLGSENLAEWVKHESEGYPRDVDVPPYRVVGVSYRGTFSGPLGAGISNAPIPPYLIKKHASESWIRKEMRESIAAIDELAHSEGELGLDASNLILLLQGKIYPDYACNEIWGTISSTALVEIQQAVRSRILELTLELEKRVPAAAEVTFGAQDQASQENIEKVERISQQIIYGNVTTISNVQDSTVNLTFGEGDGRGLVDFLVDAGIAHDDANELAGILSQEKPTSAAEPFGEQAKNWLASNIRKAVDGTWKVGVSVATRVLSEAALKYYGLK